MAASCMCAVVSYCHLTIAHRPREREFAAPFRDKSAYQRRLTRSGRAPQMVGEGRTHMANAAGGGVADGRRFLRGVAHVYAALASMHKFGENKAGEPCRVI